MAECCEGYIWGSSSIIENAEFYDAWYIIKGVLAPLTHHFKICLIYLLLRTHGIVQVATSHM